MKLDNNSTLLDGIVNIREEPFSWKKSLIYIAIAYLFGLFVRLLMWLQAMQIDAFWDGSLPVPLWQPDAGRYGYYAKNILSGVEIQYSADYLVGHLVAFVVSVTGFSVDWVMLLLPIFLASLIVIPIIMIGNALKIPRFSFLVALIAVSGKLFYGRSYVGYMDTDGVNLFLILLSMAFIMLSIKKLSIFYALAAAIIMILFGIWYHSASSILLSIVTMTLLYVISFERKNTIALQVFVIISISILPIVLFYKLGLLLIVGAIFHLLNMKSDISYRFYLALIVAATLMALILVNYDPYISRAMGYLSENKNMSFIADGIKYIYPSDLLTVSEARSVNLWRSSGPTPIYTAYIFVGTLGYLLMLIRYRAMLITLPLILLGYISSFAGIRFAMYATVPISFGAVYTLYILRDTLTRRFKSIYTYRVPYYGTMILLVVMIWNIFYINKAYIITLDFYAKDKQALREFGKNIDSNDTIVNAWDYGWPLWYYTGHDNTVADNGYHGGPDTNLIYKIFMSTDQTFSAKASLLLAKGRLKAREDSSNYILPILLRDQDYTELLASIGNNKIKDYKYNGDVYIFLHKRMMTYFATMYSTAAEDLHRNITDKYGLYRVTQLVKPFSKTYSLVEGYDYILDSSEGMVTDADGNKTKLNTIMLTDRFKKKSSYTFHKDAKNYMFTWGQKLYWLDEKYYNSFYVQAMMFDSYDRDLFEKVAETNRFKILKIKR